VREREQPDAGVAGDLRRFPLVRLAYAQSIEYCPELHRCDRLEEDVDSRSMSLRGCAS